MEHINYMLGWQQLLAEQGFGQFVERCGLEAANCLTDGRRAIRAVTEKKKGARKKTTPKVRSATARACDGVQHVWVRRHESAMRRLRGLQFNVGRPRSTRRQRARYTCLHACDLARHACLECGAKW